MNHGTLCLKQKFVGHPRRHIWNPLGNLIFFRVEQSPVRALHLVQIMLLRLSESQLLPEARWSCLAFK